jgi:hypothetical protein
MKIDILKEFIKKTVQQEVRSVVQSELKLQLAEIFSKEVLQAKKKSSDSDLEQQILKELETMNESVVEEPVKPAKKFVKYTSNPMLNDILASCKNDTKLCIASNLTGTDELIQTKTIVEWKKDQPDLHKKPTIFLIYRNR